MMMAGYAFIPDRKPMFLGIGSQEELEELFKSFVQEGSDDEDFLPEEVRLVIRPATEQEIARFQREIKS